MNKQNFGKFLCFCLSMLIAFSSLSYAQAAPLTKDGTFKPSKAITRAELAKIVNKAFGFSQKSTSSFRDVRTSDAYYKDMLIAKKAGYYVKNAY